MEATFLQILWFIFWGVLWAVYFALDGFDLGSGSLLYLVSKDEKDRKSVYQAIGPFWDGNEVWLITAGGATFAAFPKAYAIKFSTLYTPLFMVLFFLILRAVAVEFRNKYDKLTWKRIWDFLFFIGSLFPPLLLGVAFSNIFKGIPIDENGILRTDLFGLLTPFTILGGLTFVSVFSTHGALWLAFRAGNNVLSKAEKLARVFWFISLVLVALYLISSVFTTNLWVNYLKAPIFFLVPLISILSFILSFVFLNKRRFFKAWLFCGLTILTFTAWGIIGLYPNLFPSSIDPAYSLTIFNSSSSPLTLTIMTIVVLIFLPLIFLYTAWAYKVLSYKLTEREIIY